MTPFTQLFGTDEEKNIYGDCWRTCIACILDIPPEGIPHFCADDKSFGDAIDEAREWLKQFDYNMQTTMYGDAPFEDFMSDIHYSFVDTFIILGVGTTRENHAVIAYNGAVIHDPSIGQTNITGSMTNGHYSIQVIAPRLVGQYKRDHAATATTKD